MESKEVMAFLEDIETHKKNIHSISPDQQLLQQVLPIRTVGSTAIIPIQGAMVKSLPPFFEKFFGVYSTNSIRSAVQQAVANKKIQSIMLLIDSPGGSVDGTVELADVVFSARQQKPVYAQVDGLAASAAYWIASQSTKIIAGRSSLIGSIGVFTMLYDFSRAFKNAGIEAIPITTGEFKTAGIMGTPITQVQQEEYQKIVDQYYADFLNAIKRGRPQMSTKTIVDAADGRIFKADQEAITMGLIDGIGWTQEQIAKLTQKRLMAKRLMAKKFEYAITQNKEVVL